MLKYFILFFLAISPLSSFSQSIKKAYKFYEKSEIIKLKDALSKMDEKMNENPGKYYLYALLYLEEIEIREKLDSAFYFVKLSMSSIDSVDAKENEELVDLNITPSALDSLEDVIDSLEFQFVLKENNIDEYRKYMRDHKTSVFYNKALENWHSLEFKVSQTNNTWQSYKAFIDSFPQSKEYPLAKKLYDDLLFREKTSDKRLGSYEKFLENNPSTPYRDSIEHIILKYYAVDNALGGYAKFINKFPNSVYKNLAIDFLYHAAGRDINKILEIADIGMLEDSLISITSIGQTPLLGIYEKGKTHFVNTDGQIVIPATSRKFMSEALCSFLTDDFLSVYEGEEKVIYNRNFTKIYAGDFTYVEDIGQGILKIFLKDRLDIIHKSGRIILSGNYDDAHIVDNSFILIESEDRFSLYTMMGEMIYDFIFSEVFQEGSFILFVSEKDDRINVLNKEEITRKIIDLKLSMNFLYDDYEYYDGDYMVLFNGDAEVLIDSTLDELTNSDARNIERFDFGWSYKSDYGIKLLSDQIVFDFSVFFDNISSSSIHFMGKNNNQWDVYLLDGGTVILDDVDSVYKITDSILWYRDELKEALYFPNSNEIVLEDDTRIKVLSSKYGSRPYVKLTSNSDEYIVDGNGNRLTTAEYYYTVESGNTLSFLAEKFGIAQSEILRLNNKKDKRLFIGEKLKIKGYVPSDAISDSLFLIEYEGKKGIADINGKIILEPEYDGLTNFSENDLILIKDESFGNYSIKDKKIIPPNFKTILRPFGEKYYLAFDQKFGLVDANGENILSLEYDRLEYWNDSTVIAKLGNDFSFINLNSKEIISNFLSYSTLLDGDHKIIELVGEDGFGIQSNIYGEVLKPAYDTIKKIELDGKMFFLANQKMKEARLLVNLLVSSDGRMIINQALDLNEEKMIICN
ncbi:MAG: WG repeat-containing protein [Bacteroidota bacterium]|nr:WG repeat-containing protein [Bacteroidota bacterium]